MEGSSTKLSATSHQFITALRAAVLKRSGEFGAAQMRPLQVKHWNVETGLFIVRAPRMLLQPLCDAILSISELTECPARLNIILAAGTLRSCHRRALLHHAQILRRIGKQSLSSSDISAMDDRKRLIASEASDFCENSK